jgi:mRNA deadenylase 3'-5' endonuclease subunit Ccr4
MMIQYDFSHRKPNVEGLEEAFTSAYAQYKKNLQAFSVDSNDEVVTSDTSEMNEPPHTTVNYRRCWTIDYIWYSNRHMVPRRILDIPSEDILRSEEGPPGWFNRLAMSDSFNRLGRLPTGLHGNHNGIPNSQFGSDHVPLMTEFEFLLSK